MAAGLSDSKRCNQVLLHGWQVKTSQAVPVAARYGINHKSSGNDDHGYDSVYVQRHLQLYHLLPYATSLHQHRW